MGGYYETGLAARYETGCETGCLQQGMKPGVKPDALKMGMKPGIEPERRCGGYETPMKQGMKPPV